jgi:hypothetical protein
MSKVVDSHRKSLKLGVGEHGFGISKSKANIDKPLPRFSVFSFVI